MWLSPETSARRVDGDLASTETSVSQRSTRCTRLDPGRGPARSSCEPSTCSKFLSSRAAHPIQAVTGFHWYGSDWTSAGAAVSHQRTVQLFTSKLLGVIPRDTTKQLSGSSHVSYLFPGVARAGGPQSLSWLLRLSVRWSQCSFALVS